MATGQINIAFAEDHVVIRKSIINLLCSMNKRLNFTIEADNGRELIDRIEASTQPDICLLDIRMPVLNGFETIIELKKRWKNIKVIVLSMFDNEVYVGRMMKNGASGFIVKTAQPDLLIKAIEMTHQVGYFYSDMVTNLLYSSASNKVIFEEHISEKEKIYLKHCCSEMTHKEIAVVMKTTPKSVDGYRDSLFRKLNLNSRYSLIVWAIQNGYFTLDIL